MTAIVGVLCKDGIVIGSDSASTFSAGNMRTIEQPSKKCEIINDELITCGTGAVGLNQRFQEILRANWAEKRKSGKPPITMCTELSTLALQNFKSTGLDFNTISYGNVTGFLHAGEFYLCEFETRTLQPEMKTKDSLWWVSMGSGQPITDPFLGFVRKIFWDDKQPDLKDGIYGTIWALQHVISLNPGGVGGPVQISILTKENNKLVAKILTNDELAEHQEYVNNFENEIKKCKLGSVNSTASVPVFASESTDTKKA